ncbi:MAG: hypothetical protein JWM47_3917, partial [Acidimicrobiales bacterium]|nr:hypothetical protein [Acidimicrobiales bacterium]
MVAALVTSVAAAAPVAAASGIGPLQRRSGLMLVAAVAAMAVSLRPRTPLVGRLLLLVGSLALAAGPAR